MSQTPRTQFFHPVARRFFPAPVLLIALATALPATAFCQQSFDDLFGGPPKPKTAKPKPTKPAPVEAQPVAPPPGETPAPLIESAPAQALPESLPVTAPPPAIVPAAPASLGSDGSPPAPDTARFTGFYQNDLAYTFAGDKHWSRFSNTFDLAAQGNLGSAAWKLGGRLVADPIYDLTSHYPRAVRDDQRFEATIREAYLDFTAADLEFRLGRQHIVWGEMVGLFFADVVSARDLRQFVLPDFDMIRLPQWAARAEYFSGDFHAEAVWIPFMTYDDIGKPGAEFYPFVPSPVTGFDTVIAKESRPSGPDDAAYGLRLSWLRNGWDLSGFYYTTLDPAAAFSRRVDLSIITYQPSHSRIRQVGGTLAKDLGFTLLKAEAVYTLDKRYTTLDPLDADGLVRQNALDYVVGLEWSFPQETRFNIQAYQRRFSDYDAGIVPERIESGMSLLLATRVLHPKLETELLWINSLNRTDWLGQLKMTWLYDDHWRLAAGVDVFEGPADGLFGQYDKRDRAYTEIRYTF
ncbi:MAG TPA: hypothetical protein PL023_00920 [Thiobacillus sp.]|nr:hypothetical protein [Thiobacillus sp.]